MIKNQIEDFTPRQERLNGIYRGVVEDNEDPLKAGRCKIRVFGVHTEKKTKNEFEGIPTNELPWAQPALSLAEGSVSGFGLWTVPLQGSHVFVFFEAGNIMQPRYFASAPGIPSTAADTSEGFNDPDGVYPTSNRLGESDFHRLARGVTDETAISYRDKTDKRITGIPKADGNTWDEPSPYYSATYPNNMVLATHSGLLIEVDSTPNKQRYHIYHPSNTFIEIDESGNTVVKINNTKFEIIKETENIYVRVDQNTTVDGQRTDRVALDEIRYVGQDREELIDGSINQYISESKYIYTGVDEDKTIGNDQIVRITVDENRTVGRNLTSDVAKNETRNVNGNLTITVDGTCKIIGDDIQIGEGTMRQLMDERIITIFNEHVHPENDSGGPTDPPTTTMSTSQATTDVSAS
uniref:Putative baseplate protein n=2 Tax=viral metagenome TaxID=1070528 RepID=A0A6M3K7B3_9ZZZZ